MSKYMDRITELMNDTPAFDIIRLQADRDSLRGQLDASQRELAKSVDILAALAGYGVPLPDEAYTLIETYHGKL